MAKLDKDHARRLMERGQLDEALALYLEAMTQDFEDWDALRQIGLYFAHKGHYGLAANILTHCAEQKPTADTLMPLGYCHRRVNRLENAEEIWRLALKATDNPIQQSELMGNLAGCYSNNGTPEKGIELYQEAIRLDPTNKHHMFNMGLLQLELGRWAEGFANYELGLETGQRAHRKYEGVTPWRPGMDIRGKTVIVWGEQGIGDEIMFASCIPDLMRDAKRVIFDCHPRLKALFERSFGIECHGTRKDIGGFEWWRNCGADYSMSITSLALLYRSEGQFPGTAYLIGAPPEHFAYAKKRIGISWAGGTVANKSHLRTIDLDQWEGLLKAFPQAKFYSLQYGPESAQQVCEFREKTGIDLIHLPSRVQAQDYSVTADFVAGLDLVISVCTSVIHLAGALGVPCWCLVPSAPAWRYGLKGRAMPWYDSVTLYRQTGEGWGDVFAEVSRDLGAFLSEPERRAAE